MTGLVANSPAVTEEDIANTAFFPEISPSSCRATMDIDQRITPQRLRQALIGSMQDANHSLSQWALEQSGAGHTTLATVPADNIDGTSVKVSQYRRAVFSFAKAELIEHMIDYDTTLSGNRKHETLFSAVDKHRREALLAIRAIMGMSHSTIELI